MILCVQNAVNFVIKNKFYYLLKNFYGVEDNNSSTEDDNNSPSLEDTSFSVEFNGNKYLSGTINDINLLVCNQYDSSKNYDAMVFLNLSAFLPCF